MLLKYKVLLTSDVAAHSVLAFPLQKRAITLAEPEKDKEESMEGNVLEFVSFSLFRVLNVVHNELSKSVTFEMVELGKEEIDIQPLTLKSTDHVYHVFEAAEAPQEAPQAEEEMEEVKEVEKKVDKRKVIKG